MPTSFDFSFRVVTRILGISQFVSGLVGHIAAAGSSSQGLWCD